MVSMPPVPAHMLSGQGAPVPIELQAEPAKHKIMSHTHEYVGVLRRKVAHKLGQEPARVRLFNGGEAERAGETKRGGETRVI